MRDRENERKGERERGRRGEAIIAFSLFRRRSITLPLLLFVALSACSVPLYKVAPAPRNIPVEAGQQATTNGLEVTASALTEDDKAFERFDANLPLAGIVAVDVKLTNRSNKTINSIKLELQDATGRKLPRQEPKQALERVMDFEGVSLYAVEGKRQTVERLQAIALPKRLKLGAQQEISGVLFFYAQQDVAQLKGLSLIVKDGKQPITLSLN